ncbi:MAG: DRTGG domain-containing protein [Bacillota bacterium]|nr:DRTGG domain-containing protein [Bacillota bacterium]
MSTTKHQQILKFIENLEIGSKVSVRLLAKELDVSEGTAYRAIKEAEKDGLVSSIPKVGTIRIAQVEERRIEDVTIKEVEYIVEAIIVAGHDNLNWTPTKFLIGAMSEENLDRYMEEKALFIVGDRPRLQARALEKGAALLITGGFTPSNMIINLAKEKALPILVSPYDTFAVTSMINRSIYDRLIERELILVEDIMVTQVKYLTDLATVGEWHKLANQAMHSRFPVVDEDMKVVGIVSAVDVAGCHNDTMIIDVMTTDIMTTEKHTSVTHLSRIMVWEGYEMVPVLDEGKLVGVVSRKDIIEAFQVIQKQPHFGETVDNMILSGFRLEREEENIMEIKGKINPFMSNEFGSASSGTLITLMNSSAYILIRKKYKVDTITDNFTLHTLEPIPVGTQVSVTAKVIHMDKKSCKIDVEIHEADKILAKGLLAVRITS